MLPRINKVTLLVSVVICFWSATASEGISCYEGVGVIGEGIQIKNSSIASCHESEDAKQTCLSAQVSVKVFGLLFDVEVGRCIEIEHIPILSCDYLLQRFNESGYIPKGLDVSALGIGNCTIDVCNSTLCNEIQAPTFTSTPIESTSGTYWITGSFPSIVFGFILYIILTQSQ